MSRGDYSRKQQAALLVGRALKTRGWQLYGWKEDRSDLMTDYFDPESWRGVAVKDGFIACVNVSAHDANSWSGQPETKLVPVRADSCPRCSGSGEDPLGWNLEEARKQPALYNTDRLRAEHLDALDRAETPSQSLRLTSGMEVRWMLPVARRSIPISAGSDSLNTLRTVPGRNPTTFRRREAVAPPFVIQSRRSGEAVKADPCGAGRHGPSWTASPSSGGGAAR